MIAEPTFYNTEKKNMDVSRNSIHLSYGVIKENKALRLGKVNERKRN